MNAARMIALVAVVLAVSSSVANASEETTDTYASLLEGAQVVPPNDLHAIGFGLFNLNATNELSYEIIECALFSGVSEIHIHGPAAEGAIGPIIFSIPLPPNYTGFFSGVLGTLDTQQLRDLNCGLWYLDIHTAAHPEGHVRGRIRGLWGWEPRPWPCLLPARQSTWGAIKSLYR